MSDFFKLCFNNRELAEQTNVLRTQDFDAVRNGPAHGIIEKNDGRAPRAIEGESHG